MEGNSKIHYGWWIVVSCCALFFVSLGMLINCQGLFFVPVCEELGFTRAQISLYVTIFNFALVLALPAAGKIFPRYNIKWILGIALTVAALGFAAMGLFHSLYSWYIMAVIRGFAYAFIMYLPIPLLIGNWFNKKSGLALGIALACSGIGGAIFSPLTSSIITSYGWRNGYFFLGILGFIIIMPFILFVVRYKPEEMGLKPYGYGEAPEVRKEVVNDWEGVTSHVALRTVAFYCLFFFAGLVSLCAYLNPQLPGYATSLGFDPSVGAFMISCVMIGQLVGKIMLGWLNDKFGTLTATFVTCALGAVAMFVLIAGAGSATFLYVAAALFGLAFGLPTVEPPILTRATFGSKDYSAIFAYITMGTALVGGIGTYVFGYIFDVTGSFAGAIWLCLICYVAAFILTVIAVQGGKAIKQKALA
ncbi:MAG TPA: MFS transporter [Syntrophomonas sp.]|nr:MFS transporter [Syntrophomonas sp.]